MLSLEQEVKNKLEDMEVKYEDFTTSNKYPDFKIAFPVPTNPEGGKSFWLDAKEKIQHINLKNWLQTDIPEEGLFIIDELSIRRLLSLGLYSGVLIRTKEPLAYYFFSVLDFLFVPKLRANRIASPTEIKGKWMIDLRFKPMKETLAYAINSAYNYAFDLPKLIKQSECIGEVPTAGIPRTKAYRYIDYTTTR